jgi:phosphatidylserine decarboxylase
MTLRSAIARLTENEALNYYLTNRIPRRSLTRLVGRLAKIEQPLVRDASIGLWRLFSDLDLSEARTTRFRSLHDCFIRELKEGARPIDPRPDILTSPCDAIIGASGRIEGGVMLQVKGSTYPLSELVQDEALVASYRNGRYITLRLTSTMYHRFHAPHDAQVLGVTHIAGDTWNVNPPALKRIRGLYCRNERAVIRMRLSQSPHLVTLVPVAAILVAGIRLNFLDMPADRMHVTPWSRACDSAFRKGDEMGWFEHGSTIIVLAEDGFELCGAVQDGVSIRMGEPLMQLPR